MTQQYYSNGKLLITGEYTVLDGASAFALPTRTGQDLIVTSNPTPHITWKSFDADDSIWFEDTFTIDDVIQSRKFNDAAVKNTLIDILHAAHIMNPDVLSNPGGYNITTHLTFPRQWGLGTSSTVINNIASWFTIDPFTLLKNSFGGSGYDIACAMTDGPLCYRLNSGHPEVEKVIFDPPFKSDIYFVYLNKKQNTKTAVVTAMIKSPPQAPRLLIVPLKSAKCSDWIVGIPSKLLRSNSCCSNIAANAVIEVARSNCWVSAVIASVFVVLLPLFLRYASTAVLVFCFLLR